MFSSFEEANEFVRTTTRQTKTGETQWEVNASGGFIQKGGTRNVVFLLFGEEPQHILVLRDLSEAFELAISPTVNPQHASSLDELYWAIIHQVGLLF